MLRRLLQISSAVEVGLDGTRVLLKSKSSFCLTSVFVRAFKSIFLGRLSMQQYLNLAFLLYGVPIVATYVLWSELL